MTHDAKTLWEFVTYKLEDLFTRVESLLLMFVQRSVCGGGSTPYNVNIKLRALTVYPCLRLAIIFESKGLLLELSSRKGVMVGFFFSPLCRCLILTCASCTGQNTWKLTVWAPKNTS